MESIDKTNHPNIDQPLSGLMALNLIFQQINKSLETRLGLSIVQWSLLKTLIEMPAASPLNLARALKVTSGTLTQTLLRLSKKNLILICDDPKDARKKIVSITRKGKQKLDSSMKYYTQLFAGIDTVTAEVTVTESFLRDIAWPRLIATDVRTLGLSKLHGKFSPLKTHTWKK